MRLFNTATRARQSFTADDHVAMYVCGITPYDSAHLGHAFTFLTYDLLRRRLEDAGHRVTMVRNITDVDEPMYPKADSLGMHYLTLAERESARFQDMMRKLGMIDPEFEPRASEYVDKIADSVQQLIEYGYAYKLDDDVYFDTSAFADFGFVSRYPESLMRTFFEARGGDPARSGKRHPLDFLLWLSVKDDHPAAWDSPVGFGRPGWHIECTAMSADLLGDTIDIHGGGTDLVFPHHECEGAQSRSLREHASVRYWTHTAPLLLGGEKMSKSLGNLVFVEDLLRDVDPAVVRLALMSYHYRMGGEWRQDILDDAAALSDRITKAVRRPDGADPRPYQARVRAALDDDLNVPEALRAVRELTDSLLAGGSSPDAATGLRDTLDLLGVPNAPAT